MRLDSLRVAGPIAAWESLGFVTRRSDEDGRHEEQFIVLPGLTLVFDDQNSLTSGVTAWGFSADPDDSDIDFHRTTIDGIPTSISAAGSPLRPDDHRPDNHRLDVIGIDHVVVMTGSLERTCTAITAAIGDPLRRVREAGRGVRQGFHKAGEVIIEVVERPDLVSTTSASLWGLVFTMRDLDTAVDWLGPDVISSPRDAVQPGRRIATVRTEVGLGVPLALMTPHQRG